MPKYKARAGETLYKTQHPHITEIRSSSGSCYYTRYLFHDEDSGSYTWPTFEEARKDLARYHNIKQWVMNREGSLDGHRCPYI